MLAVGVALAQLAGHDHKMVRVSGSKPMANRQVLGIFFLIVITIVFKLFFESNSIAFF